MEQTIMYKVIGAAMEVHRNVGGPGLLESVYEAAFCKELALRGVSFRRQVPVPVVYKGVQIGGPLFLDLLVEDELVVEVKATGRNHPVFHSQVLTYLRLAGKRMGLVVNFGHACVRDGIMRVVNNFSFVPAPPVEMLR